MHTAATHTASIRMGMAVLVLVGSIVLCPAPSGAQSSSDTTDILVLAARAVVERFAPNGRAALTDWPTQNFAGALTSADERLGSVGRRTGLPVPASDQAFECDQVARRQCRPVLQRTLLMLGIPIVRPTAAEVQVEVAYPSGYKQLLLVELRRASQGGWMIASIRGLGVT